MSEYTLKVLSLWYAALQCSGMQAYKKAKCCLCQKVGHLARVCQTAGSKSTVHKDVGAKASRPTQK